METAGQITLRLKIFPDYVIIPKKNLDLGLLTMTFPGFPLKYLSSCSESQRAIYYSITVTAFSNPYNHRKSEPVWFILAMVNWGLFETVGFLWLQFHLFWFYQFIRERK